ncbi:MULTISPECIES: hypothetical protein [Vibrio]|uniref:hypothetical protein n=1 Tax=Vibrio TaxID=662 RepID=UPI0004E74860|nr:hypothetical protein [Vibrio parahaemolyticus]ELC9583482.1 hypothetical protein [Vibrio vulnificus]WDE69825.1 hypothetical protein VPHZ6_orf00042 [Vibrio phage VPHZ6]KFE94908.1 hypothetical protein HB39_12455 [Vibrio parahaemolyticus]MBX5338952.1 hypothetical protein [Vibrio parahaemolyticus]TOK32788.1 hypothetical protein CGI19_20315 [Vibrio parahaemolyticus]
MGANSNYTRGAAVMCNRPRFRLFLSEIAQQDIETKDQAAAVIRDWCGVQSRRELNRSEKAGAAYRGLISMYNDWLGGASV